MKRTTYEAAWRLLEILGDDRPPRLQAAADLLRECMEHEGKPVSQIPENPYFLETTP